MELFYPNVNDEGQIAISSNGHYALYSVERVEREMPDASIRRYEIVNLATLGVEARVANFVMAVEILNEFDRRIEALVNGEEGITMEEGEAEYGGVSSPMKLN